MQLSPLSKTFHEIAKDAHDAFPQQLDKLVVVATSTMKPVYISPEIADQLSQNTAAIGKAIRKHKRYMARNKGVAGLSDRCDLAGVPVFVIAMNGKFDNVFFWRRENKVQAISVMNHEIGHQVLRNGYADNDNLAECAADAFSMLLHIRRYGLNTDYEKNRCGDRAGILILQQDPDHYTAEATQRAIEIAHEMGNDFFKLSLREIAKIAADIADETYLDDKRLRRLIRAFQPVKATYDKLNASPSLSEIFQYNRLISREVLAVMEKHRYARDIIRAGRWFLSVPPFLAEANKENPGWQEEFRTAKSPRKRRTAAPKARR